MNTVAPKTEGHKYISYMQNINNVCVHKIFQLVHMYSDI